MPIKIFTAKEATDDARQELENNVNTFLKGVEKDFNALGVINNIIQTEVWYNGVYRLTITVHYS